MKQISTKRTRLRLVTLRGLMRYTHLSRRTARLLGEAAGARIDLLYGRGSVYDLSRIDEKVAEYTSGLEFIEREDEENE